MANRQSETEASSTAGGRSSARPDRKTAYGRALRLRCPNCGKGRLLHSYLTPVGACDACGEKFGHIRSDDAAPWLTILFVGHILVPLMVAVESADRLPEWASILVWPLSGLSLAALILPRAKALIMAIIWYEHSPGSETETSS